ncbi:hypothetical protein N7462_003438 [Penicillium macrosclerotiorum]|uniref:uncharacterized protein n=1 Tax=Penicillium macrosclerotiorum TaxID=303699 RepID=UPI002547AF07|nr:uncharacterized protein N7462_003438 [Penicillium macrosclerotiorum]KAJ5689046.1 hypothetical protein N7462_003438 [Penicillium macrosclerotiorum]
MANKGNARLSIVEDVPIPRPLLATANFNSPWEFIKWEKSLPKNDRILYQDAANQTQQGGLKRSFSLSSRKVQRPKLASRPLSNPPVSPIWGEFKTPTSLTPRSGSFEKEPITPIKNAALSPTHLSETSSHTLHSRQSSIHDTYEKAKARSVALHRKYWVRLAFEYGLYILLILFVYFVLIGVPLWNGAVWWLYWVVRNKFVIQGGYAITIGLAALYAFLPLLILFEKDPPEKIEDADLERSADNAESTALLIPCYKSANIIGPTLKAALKIFPPKNIFVIANGNSETPLDNTEEVCRPYGVNHLWVPIGSKIVAQFAGCYAAKGFENVLLIDDDCALPPNFPIVSDRLQGKVKCIGYTIKSVGPNSSKGTFCQQAQDLEYKMSGLQRAFFGKLGSATFPHGAISIWNTEFLKKTFHEHPGFSVSENWFFGDSCRRLGGRITMCSSVFVETETPSSWKWESGWVWGDDYLPAAFQALEFLFVVGMYYDMKYILTSWKLGWWEIGAKLCVFQEVYETLIYLLAPFVLPISFIVRPGFCGMLLGVTIAMYIINVILFNEIHLRLKKERIDWIVLLFYYTFYKIALTVINVVSCYWSLYKYARYFSKRHPKVIEDQEAIQVVLSLEQDAESIPEEVILPLNSAPAETERAYRRLTLTRVEPDPDPRWPLMEMKQIGSQNKHASLWI